MFIQKVQNILPTIISLGLLHLLRVSYLKDKIKIQMSRYDITEDDHEHIFNITEDVYTSISFLGAIVAIFIGIVVNLFNSHASSHYQAKVNILIILLLLYSFEAIAIVFFMKKKLLKSRPKWFQKITYKNIYDGMLYLGYSFLILFEFI